MPPWIEVPDLAAEAWRLLAQVPAGRVTTYGDIARALGDVGAAKWVAELLLEHVHTDSCDCHRVVRAGGALGLYGDESRDSKRDRLLQDGIPLEGDAVAPERLWYSFEETPPAPLRALQEFQNSVFRRLSLRRRGRSAPKTLGALDVAYPAPGMAKGAYALLDADTLEVLWTLTIDEPVRFPYIPGYLTFRELPILEVLWKQVAQADRAGDVVLIDGNGILHPRRAGIAATFGLLADWPTIGVTKSKLCGQIAGELAPLVPVPVLDGEEPLGAAILPASGSAKPIYVSPGNHIGIEEATRITLATFRSHRVPEPIFHADRLSKGR